MPVLESLPILDISACRSALVREPLAVERAAELARAFKALAEPARLRLLSLIAAHERGEACVCDLTEPLGLSQPTVSHHLKVLREADLITGERRGTWVHYRIVPGALERLGAVLADVVEADDTPSGVLRPGC
ncbi:ArsR/SmtB family transcription factor [Georgenia muralis]|uniref:ArsR family transcriptional regulator n=1 Tax=Georgenia muralis TaxID=154117 RepID=A0A3N5A1R7_9MICO|nr:metalloregulator ArsR/SmtB family transcription factor [Georgenia muralis]RPF27305.1 ArsR family transcriptional regulator [Georgenia muralis]